MKRQPRVGVTWTVPTSRQGRPSPEASRRVVLATAGKCRRLVREVRGDDLLAVRRKRLEDVLVRSIADSVDWGLHCTARDLRSSRAEATCSQGSDTGPDVCGEGDGTSPSLRDAHVVGGLEDPTKSTRDAMLTSLVEPTGRWRAASCRLTREVVDLVALGRDGAAVAL